MGGAEDETGLRRKSHPVRRREESTKLGGKRNPGMEESILRATLGLQNPRQPSIAPLTQGATTALRVAARVPWTSLTR